MPPRASSRLRLFVLRGPNDTATAGELLAVFGALMPHAVAYGGRERFFANGQGGFRVACPLDDRLLAGPFRVAIEAWRAGGPRSLSCPCGQEHDLDALRFEPPAGFAREAVVVNDAPSAELAADTLAAVATLWPGVRLVGSRG